MKIILVVLNIVMIVFSIILIVKVQISHKDLEKAIRKDFEEKMKILGR